MENFEWKVEDLLAVGESIVYKCVIKDVAEDEDEYEYKIPVILTNHRIIWVNGDFVDCRLLKFISKYGIFEGYDDYVEDDDIGQGEYGIYFGDFKKYETLWFYSKGVWKTFYDELSRTIIENL